MIVDALVSFIRAQTGLTCVITRAPLNSVPVAVINDNGDRRGYHYGTTRPTETDLIEHEFELTVWVELSNAGPRWAAQQVEAIIAALDNFAGPLTDTAGSPNTTHTVSRIECYNGGGSFDNQTELWAHSAFITVTYH